MSLNTTRISPLRSGRTPTAPGKSFLISCRIALGAFPLYRSAVGRTVAARPLGWDAVCVRAAAMDAHVFGAAGAASRPLRFSFVSIAFSRVRIRSRWGEEEVVVLGLRTASG